MVKGNFGPLANSKMNRMGHEKITLLSYVGTRIKSVTDTKLVKIEIQNFVWWCFQLCTYRSR